MSNLISHVADPSVLKKSVVSEVTRKLGNPVSTDLYGAKQIKEMAAIVVPGSPAQPSPEALRATLKVQFSVQLAELEEEARKAGLKNAADEAVSALKHAREQVVSAWKLEEDKLRASLKSDQEKLRGLIVSLAEEREQMLGEMAPALVELLFASLIKILGRHALEGELVKDIAAQAIKEYRIASPFRILISRVDYERMAAEDTSDSILDSLRVDDHAKPGSCLIDYGNGSLDASLEKQLESLKQLLLRGNERVE
ncbi:MAG: FliH/SctL family protein [Fluviicoccus sp.]|uniref:FliH/SctL family protein n=1 Tax=Fluviicoccus sp. TaxID=2003552 RepID=UPI00272402F4|nr:FliH/SctL family protein [Fluviicoccus sp.]MDO8330488.1 FliH/SctL family protein [Fluviicoccus sp.]